jgi:DMSO/TMAO reductase YedYZ heme-binding membrane subunit
MNIRKLKEKLYATLIGGFIFALWVVYAILTDFNFVAFITNPTVISVVLILSVPLAFLLSDVLWGQDK